MASRRALLNVDEVYSAGVSVGGSALNSAEQQRKVKWGVWPAHDHLQPDPGWATCSSAFIEGVVGGKVSVNSWLLRSVPKRQRSGSPRRAKQQQTGAESH